MIEKRVLMCSYYLPQADRDSYSRRLLHFVQFLREAGHAVTCVAKNSAGVDQHAAVLHELGVPNYVGFEEHIERLATTQHFDLAILGFWHMAESAIKSLRRCSAATRIVVDSGDLHFLRHARRILRDGPRNDDLDILDSQYASETIRELNVYAAADAVLAVSHKEAEFVNDFLGERGRAYFVPDCEELEASRIPFEQRQGMFFVGNFQHLPNTEAAEFLCQEILPQFDPLELERHPVYIAGNAMTEAVRKFGERLPCVRMLGWIPSVLPYLERVRVSLVPLLHGAGTKRKMIQALAIGTPTVSTSIGVEGLDLRDGEDVLVADDPVDFANATIRLLQDAELWGRLACQGRRRILTEHGREAARERLLEAVSAVLVKSTRSNVRRSLANGSARVNHREYQQIVRRTREIVCSTVPPESTTIVVSKGDDSLLTLGERIAWHFPRAADGVYAGHYPANSVEAISHLEALRDQGADYLVIPKTAFWWLEHYTDFKQHLESRYRLAAHEANSCVIFSLRERPQPTATKPVQFIQPAVRNDDAVNRRPAEMNSASEAVPIESRRPTALDGVDLRRTTFAGRPKVLVLGVFLGDRASNIGDIAEILSRSSDCSVVQRWAAVGGPPPTPGVSAVTSLRVMANKPKLQIVDDLLGVADFADFDYVLLCDDDVILPHEFLDRLVSLQSALGLDVAQPALTPNSFIDRPIVEQQRGIVARQTAFVGLCPIVSFHRSTFGLVFPFRESASFGLGNELAIAAQVTTQGMCLGIIDAVPVDRSLREPHSNESQRNGGWQQESITANQTLRVGDPFRVLAVAGRPRSNGKSRPAWQSTGNDDVRPRISVVIPTHNRAKLLQQSLESLAAQSIPVCDFEVIVVDDGSTDETAEVCGRWSSQLSLTHLAIQRSGIASAKNLGVFAARGPVILFFDDDDIADENLLAEHLKTHARYPLQNVAVLGYTAWAPSLEISPVMRFITDIGHYLFSYSHLTDGQRLDFNYFWGGRTSCKKSLLTMAGVFCQQFEFGSEDIELGFRLSKILVERRLLGRKCEVDEHDAELSQRLATIGLAVIYNRQAIQYMNRPITYDEFCRRCERQGKSQWQFSRLYTDTIIHRWCHTTGAFDRWRQTRDPLSAHVARVHRLEAALQAGGDAAQREILLAELHRLYWWTFDAFKTKGMAAAMAAEALATAAPASSLVKARDLARS